MIVYHLIALILGTILDSIIGDPHGIYHPVITIGKWIDFLDKKLNKSSDIITAEDRKKRGYMLVILVIVPVILTSALIVVVSYKLSTALGIIFEAIISSYCLAKKSLIDESKKVITAYEQSGIESSRAALSMIVGRDTAELEIDAVIRATVETVAENSSDGVIAPLFYLLLGGPIAGLTYKAINTMDSMVGYHNEKYEDFGYAAAKLDDFANFIPSRLTGALTIFAADICKDFDGVNARKIFYRDRFNHKSPNSAQSEAAFAGALSIQLGGPSKYFGELVDKPTIGDNVKSIGIKDVFRAHKLLNRMCLICQIMLVVIGAIAVLRHFEPYIM